MRYKKLKLSAVLMLGLGITGLQAQESINTAGGNASGSGGSVSYSVGQVTYQTYTGTNGSVAEGVQQPYEISVLMALEETKGINLLVSVYPNPTSDYLTLSISDNVKPSQNLSFLSYQLNDMNGKILQSEIITGNQTSIDMSNLLPATYFVKVLAQWGNDRTGIIQKNKKLITFKVLKK